MKKPSVKKVVKKVAKPAAKKTVKAPAKRIVVKKASAKKPKLVIAESGTAFYATNGAVLYSLADLFTELSTMNDEEFSFHIWPENHFSAWVEKVLFDKNCAADLEKADTRRKARSVIKKYLAEYAH